MSVAAGTVLAPDRAVPLRDVLLDPELAPVPVDAISVQVVRCKYRVGESLRVLYRCATPDGDRMVTVRAGRDRAPRWWTLPDDRRLSAVDALMAPSPGVAALAHGGIWTSSEIAEYAPERSITVRALDARRRAVAYAKHYAPGLVDVAALADRYRHVAASLGGGGAPRPLGWSAGPDILVLEAMPGSRWADLPASSTVRVGALTGRAIAALHDVTPPAGTPVFLRLSPGRIRRAVAVLGTARPDVAAAARRIGRQLIAAPPDEPAVLVHGDCHPKNAVVDRDRVALIDLDQGGSGPAAADLGSLVARVRVSAITGGDRAARDGGLVESFLAGYRSVRELPPPGTMRWHTAAAMLVEQAVRAVNRVRYDVLRHLPDVLDDAASVLTDGRP